MLQRQAPVEVARAALDDARSMRARHLLRVTLGEQKVLDLMEAARSADGVPLRQIKLRQLVLAQPGVGHQKAGAFLSAVAAILEERADIGSQTVGWLIDPRAGGRRLLCWLDASARHDTPWPGFPFTPDPHAEATPQ